MGGYLNQNEIDSLLKGVSKPAASSKEQDHSPQPLSAGKQDYSPPVDRAGQKKSPLVERVEFAPLETRAPSLKARKPPLDFFQNVALVLSGELGAAEITVRDFLRLKVGSVLTLDKMAGESAAILLNGQNLGQAEVVVINDRFGLRVTAIGAKESEAEKTLPDKNKNIDSPAPPPEKETGQGG